MRYLSALRAALSLVLLFSAADALAAPKPCFIFVHGMNVSNDTYVDWNKARNYWVKNAHDGVGYATQDFAASYYVVGYDGTKPYWEALAAGEVANEIANAVSGGPDGGGNTCAKTYEEGGEFWVIAHSMGATIMDYILGNNDPSDPNYNFNGPYDVVAEAVTRVITLGGAHRGSEVADHSCGFGGSRYCEGLVGLFPTCGNGDASATWWLRTADDVQVRTYASAPAKDIYLIGGYEAGFQASLCLSGEDDGLVQYTSQFACNGDATASIKHATVCDSNNKQEISGFFNLDTAHEGHLDQRNGNDQDDRRPIPDGYVWMCNGEPCQIGKPTGVKMSSMQFISTLY